MPPEIWAVLVMTLLFRSVALLLSEKMPPPAAADLLSETMLLSSVAWLKLNAVEGDYKDVYRVHTAGGMAPKNCAGQKSRFEVQYSAQYWFYG